MSLKKFADLDVYRCRLLILLHFLRIYCRLQLCLVVVIVVRCRLSFFYCWVSVVAHFFYCRCPALPICRSVGEMCMNVAPRMGRASFRADIDITGPAGAPNITSGSPTCNYKIRNISSSWYNYKYISMQLIKTQEEMHCAATVKAIPSYNFYTFKLF